MPDERINIHIYHSVFKNDSRILKECNSIIDNRLADKVIILARWKKGLPLTEQVSANIEVHRIKLYFDKFSQNKIVKSVLYPSYTIVAYLRYRKLKPLFVNCHGLPLIFFGVLIKWSTKSKLILDAHELETERNGLKGAAKKFLKVVEKTAMPYVDLVIVVSDSIAQWYRETYKTNKIVTIKNTPYKSYSSNEKSKILREKFNIKDNQLVFIYQGLFGKGRNIEMYLNAFSQMPDKYQIILMGFGPLEDMVKRYDADYPNIHFQPGVPPKDIKAYTSGADVGLCIIENICLSYYYCLPNKLFEYIHAGLPQICSNFPDMSGVISKYNCGWVIPTDERHLKQLLLNISPDDIESRAKNCNVAVDSFNWANEEKQYVKVIKRLIDN